MTPIIVLAIVVGTPVLLGLLFRVSSLYMYISVVVGQLLLTFVGDDAALAAGGFVKGQYSQMISSLFLLLMPLVVTFIFLRHTVPKSKLFFHLPAYVAVGGSLYIFLVPLLTAGVVGAILASPLGKAVNTSQDIIIAASGLIILSTMWLTGGHHERGHHGKHHK